jgi:hypothetical protein
VRGFGVDVSAGDFLMLKDGERSGQLWRVSEVRLGHEAACEFPFPDSTKACNCKLPVVIEVALV